MELSDWVFLGALVVTLIEFVLSLRPFFQVKLIMYLTAITLMLGSLPNVVIGSSEKLSVAACYMAETLFISSVLWDSRQFIIDNFSLFRFLVSRPAYVLVPGLILLVSFDVLPLIKHMCVWLIITQILVAALVSEIAYSVSKRNDWLLRTRRGSLPRMETISGTTPTSQIQQTLV
jgi:hypothetical protein